MNRPTTCFDLYSFVVNNYVGVDVGVIVSQKKKNKVFYRIIYL